MRFIKYILILLLAFTSCKSKKDLVAASSLATEMSARKVAKNHMAVSFDKKTVDVKLKGKFKDAKTNQSFSVRMKIKKDEVIWLKGTKFITVFKAEITPTSIKYYSPYFKNYFEGDFSMLKELLGTDINFQQLQNLLLGQAVNNIRKQKQEVEIVENSHRLSPKKQSNLFDLFFFVNPSHYKLNKQSIINSLKSERLDVIYPSYSIKEKEVFPDKILIRAKKPNKYTNIDLTVKSVVFDSDVHMSFSIPEGYKKITF